MLSSIFATLIVWSSAVLCVIFTQQDIGDLNAQWPGGHISEECNLSPRGPLWDRDTHDLLDKYVVGAQVLNDPSCADAHDFLSQLPVEDIDPALDFPPVE